MCKQSNTRLKSFLKYIRNVFKLSRCWSFFLSLRSSTEGTRWVFSTIKRTDKIKSALWSKKAVEQRTNIPLCLLQFPSSKRSAHLQVLLTESCGCWPFKFNPMFAKGLSLQNLLKSYLLGDPACPHVPLKTTKLSFSLI